MNPNPHTYKLLMEQYLDGLLSHEESNRLKSMLEANPAMQEEFRMLQEAVEAARLNGLNQFVGSVRRSMLEENRSSSRQPSPTISITRWTMRIAAGFLLLAGSFSIYKYVSVTPQTVYSKYYESYQLNRTRSSIADPAEEAFNKKQWNEVIRMTGMQQPLSNKYLFLSGIASLETGHPGEAIDRFSMIVSGNDKEGRDEFNDEAEYYLALGYLQSGETDKAASLFSKIRNDEQHLYHQTVKEKNVLDLKVLSWKTSK